MLAFCGRSSTPSPITDLSEGFAFTERPTADGCSAVILSRLELLTGRLMQVPQGALTSILWACCREPDSGGNESTVCTKDSSIRTTRPLLLTAAVMPLWSLPTSAANVMKPCTRQRLQRRSSNPLDGGIQPSIGRVQHRLVNPVDRRSDARLSPSTCLWRGPSRPAPRRLV